MLATEPSLAIVWDEGFTLGREARARAWIAAMIDPEGHAERWRPPSPDLVTYLEFAPPPARDQIDTRAELLRPDILDWFWPFAREEPHGHPPFYALVGLVGDVLTPWRPQLARARLGPMIAFSLLAGVLYGSAARRFGVWAGAAAAGAWVLQPRVFAHAHYAHYDALLTCLWVGSILAFLRAVEPRDGEPRRGPRWGWAVLFGVLAGCAAGTKLTGWFLPLPFLAWAALYRDRSAGWTLLVGGLLGMLTLYALTPPWWPDPIGGIERFLRSNLTRGQTNEIRVLFLGRIYRTPNESLPWYNTLFWTAAATPVGILLLSISGAARSLRRRRSEPLGALAPIHLAFLLILRALPHAPGHDGIRLFLPAFGCLALLAGPGAAWLIGGIGRWGKALVLAALAEGAVGIALLWPVPLSYYSPIVGGSPGASALGMEPTYYWDALTPGALDWLNRHSGPGVKVQFDHNPTSWLYLRHAGILRAGIFPEEPGDWGFYVLQNRPGMFSALDRALVERGRPAFVVSKRGVPLLWIFPYEQVRARRRALGETGDEPWKI